MEYSVAGEPSVRLRSTSSAGRCSSPVRTTERSRLSRYGMTFGPSTEFRSAVVLTSWLAGFPARTCLLSETGLESGVTSQDCGRSSRGSSEKSDRSGCSWRIRQTSSGSDSTSSYMTLTRSGTMRNGLACQRPSSEPVTSETGFGYLQRYGDQEMRFTLQKLVEDGKDSRTVELPPKEFEFFPTPTYSDAKNRGTLSQLLREYIPLSCRVRMTDGVFDNSPGGRTNPMWTEWLMGWPITWNSLEPLATDRFRQWLQRHSKP